MTPRTRRGAVIVGRRAHRRMGVPLRIAIWIALAARKYGVRYAVAFGMFEQESNFKVIYGHDLGGLNPGLRVTRENYLRFRAEVIRRDGGGSNGVGLGQVTWWTYIKARVGLWKPRVQVYLATEILANLIQDLGEERGVGAYNGGPSSPNMSYAAEVLARAKNIRPKLQRKGKK